MLTNFLLTLLLLQIGTTHAAEDFYKLLGISRSASQKEIKKAYRSKSLEFHPDKNKNEGAAEKFAEIAYAYEVLTDEEKKNIYDRHGEEGLKQHEQRQGQGGGHGGFDDIFSHFGFNFGGGGHGGGRQQREQSTPNVNIPLRVSLKQLYLGDTIEVEYVRQTLCVNWQECMKANQECQGPGIKVRMQQIAPGFVQQVQQRDERCIGRGKMWSSNCRVCPGGQTQSEKIDLTIDLQKGMYPGEPITFEGVADEKPGVSLCYWKQVFVRIGCCFFFYSHCSVNFLTFALLQPNFLYCLRIISLILDDSWRSKLHRNTRKSRILPQRRRSLVCYNGNPTSRRLDRL